MEKAIKHFFDSYKDANEGFQTSDGFVFHKEHDAEAHAKGLSDKKVQPYKRGEVIEITPEDLANNPDLAEAGVQAGEVVGIPPADAPQAPKRTRKKTEAPESAQNPNPAQIEAAAQGSEAAEAGAGLVVPPLDPITTPQQ